MEFIGGPKDGDDAPDTGAPFYDYAIPRDQRFTTDMSERVEIKRGRYHRRTDTRTLKPVWVHESLIGRAWDG